MLLRLVPSRIQCEESIAQRYREKLKEAQSKRSRKGARKNGQTESTEIAQGATQENANEGQADEGSESEEEEESEEEDESEEDWADGEEEEGDEEEESEVEEGLDDDDDVGRSRSPRRRIGLRKTVQPTPRMIFYTHDVDDSEPEDDPDNEPSSYEYDEGDIDLPDMSEYSTECKKKRAKMLYSIKPDDIACLLQQGDSEKRKSAELKKALGIKEDCMKRITDLLVVDNERLYVYLSSWLHIRGTAQRERVVRPNAQYFTQSLDNQLKSNLMNNWTDTRRYVDKGSGKAMHLLVVTACASPCSPHEDASIPEGPREKNSPPITRRRPAGVREVIEHTVFLNIFTDGFVAYDNYTRKYSSFYALSLLIENCNSYDAVNEVFSRFVTVMGKGGKKKCEERANSILKVLSAVGDEGVYYNYKDVCYHIRWVVDGICGDMVALEEFSNHPAKHCSVHHCMFGDCQRWRLEPFTGLYQQYDLECTLGKRAISVDVSPPFYSSGAQDFYTNVCFVANMSSEKELVDKINALEREASAGEWDRSKLGAVYRRAREQLTDVYRLLSRLDRGKAFFWKESFKSTYMNDMNRVTLLSLLSEEDPRIRQMEENDGDDGESLRRRIIGEDDKEKSSVGVVEVEKITPVEEKTRSLLDCMHFIPNFFYRNLRYMNGLLPTPSVMADLPAFSECINGLFRDENGLAVDSMELWRIPEETMICAMQRLRQFRQEHVGFTWVTEDIILPSYYVKLTCEQKILFCLCLFRWVFQDSLKHPFIFALSECLQLIGYLYAFNRYPERALEAQKRLKFFMGVIETITPPGFTNTSWHNAIHLFENIINGGTMKEKDDFFCEYLLGLLKNQANGGSNPEIAMARSAIRLQRSAASGIVMQLCLEKKTVGKTQKKTSDEGDCLASGLPLLQITQANLIDDAEFHREDTIGHETFLDVVPSFDGEEDAEERVSNWLQSHESELGEYSVSDWNEIIYSDVTWYGKHMGSCELPTEGVTETWLKENEKFLGYTRDAEGVIRVYIITGYVVFKVNDMNYIQALCVPLPASTSCSFCESQQEVCISPPETVKIAVISLFRLHIGRGLVLCYQDSLLTFTLMKMVCRQSRNVGHVRLFEKVVRYTVPEKRGKPNPRDEQSPESLKITILGLEDKNAALKQEKDRWKKKEEKWKKEREEWKKKEEEWKEKEKEWKKKEKEWKEKETMLRRRGKEKKRGVTGRQCVGRKKQASGRGRDSTEDDDDYC